MGQAKRSGTFEECKARAIARNNAVQAALPNMPEEHQRFARRRGIHRLGVVLVLAGAVITTRKLP